MHCARLHRTMQEELCHCVPEKAYDNVEDLRRDLDFPIQKGLISENESHIERKIQNGDKSLQDVR